jgi:succinate-semialdehyde dehydrogenase/glutarate-semialdehyde dehydrogenase
MNLKDPALLRHEAFIDGEWQSADDKSTFEVVDPSNGESLGTVPRGPHGARKPRRNAQ